MTFKRAVTLAILALCLYTAALRAQASRIPSPEHSSATFRVIRGAGTLTGQVMATSGQPVASALVWLDGDTTARTYADRLGRFALPAPNPGNHTLEVRFTGFGPLRSPLLILADTRTFADVLLVPLPLDGPGSGFEVEAPSYPDTLKPIPKAVDRRPSE